jgi:hypothetical protein
MLLPQSDKLSSLCRTNLKVSVGMIGEAPHPAVNALVRAGDVLCAHSATTVASSTKSSRKSAGKVNLEIDISDSRSEPILRASYQASGYDTSVEH